MAVIQNFFGWEFGDKQDDITLVPAGVGIALDGSARTGTGHFLVRKPTAGGSLRTYHTITVAAPTPGQDLAAKTRFFLRVRAYPDLLNELVGGFYTSAWACVNGMRMDQAGRFNAAVFAGGGGASAWSASNLVLNTWYDIEITVHIHNDVSPFAVDDYIRVTVDLKTEAGALIESVAFTKTNPPSFNLNQWSIGPDGNQGNSTCFFEYDDAFFITAAPADIGSVVLPTATRVSAVRITGQGAGAGFVGDWKGVRDIPSGLAGVGIQTGVALGDTTTFLHQTAAALGIGAVYGAKLVGAVKSDPSTVFMSGGVEIAPVANWNNASYSKQLGRDWTALTTAQFDAWEFGVRQMIPDPDTNLDGIMAAVLHEGTPVNEDSAVDSYQCAGGEYVGTGAAWDVVTVGFRPQAVLVMAYSAGTGEAALKTREMGNARSQRLGSSTGARGDMIQHFLDNGFELGASIYVNAINVNYTWIAWRDGGAHATGFFFRTGGYNGDGIDDRSIVASPVLWQPNVVMVCRTSGNIIHRSDAHVGDRSTQWKTGTVTTWLANLIQAFEASGFQIGSHAEINANVECYFYLAWCFGTAGLLETLLAQGSYAGTGAPLVPAVAGIIRPDVVFAKAPTVSMVWRKRLLQPGGTSHLLGGGASQNNYLTAINADGFDVGALLSVAATTHYWLVFLVGILTFGGLLVHPGMDGCLQPRLQQLAGGFHG